MIEVAPEADEPGSGTALEPDEAGGGMMAVAPEGDEPGSGTDGLRSPEGELIPDGDEPGNGTEPRDGELRGGMIAVAPEADDPGRGTEARDPELAGGPKPALDGELPGSGTAPRPRSSGGAGIDIVGWTLKSGLGIETVCCSGVGPSPIRVGSSLNEVGEARCALSPGSGTVVGEIFTPGAFTASRFEGGAAARLAPGIVEPGSGTGAAFVTVCVASSPHGDGPRAAPGSGTPTGATRVGSSSQLCGEGADAEMPGSGTAPPAPAAGRLAPGKGTVPDPCDTGGVAPGLTGKMFWQVGHLMRAPVAGIFLSSMVRLELQDGHATFMELLRSAKAPAGARTGADERGNETKPADVTLRSAIGEFTSPQRTGW